MADGPQNRAHPLSEPMPDKRGEVTVEGRLGRVVFQNPESQWTVARLQPEDDDEITVVGELLGVREGTELRLRGTWELSPRFGRQFRIQSYHTKSPETELGIERFLSSGIIPGIGPELAKRIVDRFHLATLDILDTAPSRLKEVDGIGEARLEKIATAWREHRGAQDVMVFLHGHGVSPAYAARIYKRYGAGAVGIIRQNPYRLALEVWGIGFKTADAIAHHLGLAKTAPERLEAGLIHTLGELAEDGHVHVPEPALIERAAKLIEVDMGLLPAALGRLLVSQLVIRELLGERGPCISLPAMRASESEAAQAVATLVTTPMRPLKLNADAAIAAFEKVAGMTFAAAQKRAVAAALMDKCVVITGGPGVGKTTIVRAIVALMAKSGRTLALAAPTGRAAKRLSESTGEEAVTLHRLLEFQPKVGDFQRNAELPLEADAVIVDEASMIDIELFRALVVAVKPAAQLVLVGDVDQLPSVGPGAVLADIIASDAVTVVRLTEIFRQAAESRIITSAHQVNSGTVPELAPPPGSEAGRSDFYFIKRNDPVRARETIVNLVAERIPQSFGFDARTEIQVLTPMHRGDLGTIALNDALQERLNPGGSGIGEITRGTRAFRIGDKVMQVRNNYDKSIFNGDIGVIEAISDKDSKLVVSFLGDRAVVYEQAELDQLIHAYAVSVHKSQGSEYPAVILPVVTQHFIMLQRNLLYTAITRGKKLVVLVGSPKAVALATRNQATRARWTWLAERIRALITDA